MRTTLPCLLASLLIPCAVLAAPCDGSELICIDLQSRAEVEASGGVVAGGELEGGKVSIWQASGTDAGISGSVLQATLHLVALNGGDAQVLRATSAGWSETTITWNSAPAAQGPVLDSVSRINSGGCGVAQSTTWLPAMAMLLLASLLRRRNGEQR